MTRQAISDAATRLFIERGFDNVTVDEIAQAADVGRMTVFNHFPRKEDLFFDLDDMGREDLLEALERGDFAIAPLEALRRFTHDLVRDEKPYVRFFPLSQRFFETIEASEPLKARARIIREELTQIVSTTLSQAVGRPADDPDAQFAAGLMVTVWGMAFIQAHRVYRKGQDEALARAVFLDLIDKGTVGTQAALAGSPYV